MYRLPLLCLLLLVAACAKNPRAQQLPVCPRVFVAEPFAQQTLVVEVRDASHVLSFAKVQALCREDEQGTRFLKLSFVFRFDKPLAKEQRNKPLLLPLFAALTQDGKTVAARQAQRLEATFDRRGQAETSWLVALPPSLFSSPESVASSTLYLGFDSAQALTLRSLRAKPRAPTP